MNLLSTSIGLLLVTVLIDYYLLIIIDYCDCELIIIVWSFCGLKEIQHKLVGGKHSLLFQFNLHGFLPIGARFRNHPQ
jgi:hypothetical protein